MSNTINYQQLTTNLSNFGLINSSAEIHGTLCGLIAGCHASVWNAWLDELGLASTEQETLVLLERLYQQTRQQMTATDELPIILLPDDAHPLRERAVALSEWCQGFLYGLGLAKINPRQFKNESQEALNHLSEITRLDSESLTESEQQEQDYVELTEFVRVATAIIYQTTNELN